MKSYFERTLQTPVAVKSAVEEPELGDAELGDQPTGETSPININTDYNPSDTMSVYARIYHLSPNALRKEMIDHQQAMQAMSEIKANKQTI